MHIHHVYDNGKIYPPSVLSIKLEDILSAFKTGANNLTCLSLGTGYVTAASAPHLILTAFKNLASISFATSYTFPEAERLRNAAKNAPAASSAGPAASAKVEAKKEEKVEEKKEEEADVDMGDLFGGGDY
jgi:large subunit ribosomal protein LP0